MWMYCTLGLLAHQDALVGQTVITPVGMIIFYQKA